MHVNRCSEVSVRLQSFVVSFGSQLPGSECLVIADTEQELASRVEDDVADPVVVACQCEQALEGCDVPDFYCLVATARGEVRT